jgi:hypothetical protein
MNATISWWWEREEPGGVRSYGGRTWYRTVIILVSCLWRMTYDIL